MSAQRFRLFVRLMTLLMSAVMSSDSEETLSSCAWYGESDAASCLTADSYHSVAGDVEYLIKQSISRDADSIADLLQRHLAMIEAVTAWPNAISLRFRITENCIARIVQNGWNQQVDDTANNTLMFDLILKRFCRSRAEKMERHWPSLFQTPFASNLWQICIDSNKYLQSGKYQRYKYLWKLSKFNPLSADQIYAIYLQMHEVAQAKDLRQNKWRLYLTLRHFTFCKSQDGLHVAVPAFIHQEMVSKMNVLSDRRRPIKDLKLDNSWGAIRR